MATGVSLNQFAVLYRTNSLSFSLENACREFDIPYTLIGGFSFFKRKEIKDALCYLQILINPRDNISAKRIINEPPRGIGDVTFDIIDQFAAEQDLTFLEAIHYIDPELVKLRKARINIKKFSEVVIKYRDSANKNSNNE